jgi:hypothetical protein
MYGHLLSKNLIAGITCLLLISGCSRKNTLVSLLKKDAWLMQIANEPKHEVQIRYTRVNLRDTSFSSYEYSLDPYKYFYPASTVKMPVAFLALEKIKSLNDDGIILGRRDDMLTAPNRPAQTPAFRDSTTASGKPNVERYIQKLFAVSDNDAYNRLYELLGADYINKALTAKGVFTGSVINHRVGVSGYSYEENRHTNNVRFFRDGKIIYDKPPGEDITSWMHNAPGSVKGSAYIDADGNLIKEPFDFSRKNFYTLKDMESTLMRVIFPKKFRETERFNLSDEDYVFLRSALSDVPGKYPFYVQDTAEYYDSYVKFLMFGDSKLPIPEQIRIYNKVGIAYGFMTDCAYIEDRQANIAFFLTATIHVNENGIYNDGNYEYDKTGMPFLARLGRMIYDFELSKAKVKNR